MKLLRSLPTDHSFYDIYAILIRVIRRSKTAAQTVSGLTEVGIIYTTTYQSIHPLLPQLATYIAIAVAIIFTIVIEGGLRVLTPLSVDAVLFRRFNGLHLPMTLAIFLATIILMIVSGTLSFQNSKEIIEAVTPEVSLQTTTQADSIYQSELSSMVNTYKKDSSSVEVAFTAQLKAEVSSYQAKYELAKQRLQNYINREKRTGNSYATRKDRIKEEMARIESEKSLAIATLQADKNSELRSIRSEFKQAVDQLKKEQKKGTSQIIQENKNRKLKRENKVESYGGRLGYFTLVCLFIFLTANILDRIHHKGSGIKETIDINQYDISPSWWINAREAIRDRINYFFQSKIKAFADATPPAPLPEQKTELYDPTQAANVTITLRIEQGHDQSNNLIYIEPKRRKIGFQTQHNQPGAEISESHTNVHAQEKKCAIKATLNPGYESVDLRQWKQRLKMYKKRLGSHTQKKIVQEKKGEKISRKTLNAIENNRKWVQHYEHLINDFLKNQKK